MFEEFYEMYEPEEQEVVALINRCIGGGFNWKGNFWEMTVVTLGMVFCDTGKVSTKEERLDWPVSDEERNSEKGWGRFGKEQICRLKIRRMKEEWAKDLVAWPWCISQVVKAHEDCPELQAVLDEYHKPVVLQDEMLGELTLDKDYDTFEGEIQWCGKGVSLSLEVNAESKPSWTRARSAAKKLLADCETWDRAMRELAAKNQTKKAITNKFVSQAMTDFLKHYLEVYFLEKPEEAQKICQQVLVNKQSREHAEKTRQSIEAANMVDLDSDPTKILEVVEIGKQLLITRGSLTTFSIANDIAKYFAIIPAMFMLAIPQLGVLNIMHLATPFSAILSALIFNALIIPCLIPLAMKGVRYRPMSSGKTLARNLLIFGGGGIITPFIGIKLIDLVIHPLLSLMGL